MARNPVERLDPYEPFSAENESDQFVVDNLLEEIRIAHSEIDELAYQLRDASEVMSHVTEKFEELCKEMDCFDGCRQKTTKFFSTMKPLLEVLQAGKLPDEKPTEPKEDEDDDEENRS